MPNAVETVAAVSNNKYDINKIRDDFPILSKKVHDKNLVYLDNAATTQKPIYVIDKVNKYYTTMNANIHRGVHALSQEATEAGGRVPGTAQGPRPPCKRSRRRATRLRAASAEVPSRRPISSHVAPCL